MTATKTQLTGGNFQDSEGNILTDGYLDFKLSQDASVTGVGNIASGITIRIYLDSDGNVAGSTSTPPVADQFIWGNDNLLPLNTFYKVTGYTAQGQPAWGPNNQQIIGSSPFDLGTWIPNQVFTWTPSTQPLVLKTDDVLNSSQTLLDIVAEGNLTAVETGGRVVLTATGGKAARPMGNRWNYANFNCPASIAGSGGGCVGIEPNVYLEGGGATTSITAPTATSGPVWHLHAASGSTVYDVNNFILNPPANISLGTLRYWEMSYGLEGTTPASTAGVWSYLGLGNLQPNGGAYVAHSTIVTSNIVGFRFDPVNYNDSNWMAIVQIGSGAITVVDTGITPDSTGARHVFTMTTDGSTNVVFLIDSVVVATIPISASTGTSGVYFSFSTISDEDSTVAVVTDQFVEYIYYETI